MSDSNHLRTWMDRLGLTSKQVAPHFGVSEQTVAHWRSQGVPKRREEHVRWKMDTWEGPGAESKLEQPLLIKPTHQQFRTWNQAALDAGKLIEDWARDGLDELAAEADPENTIPMVADGTQNYQAPNKKDKDDPAP